MVDKKRTESREKNRYNILAHKSESARAVSMQEIDSIREATEQSILCNALCITCDENFSLSLDAEK